MAIKEISYIDLRNQARTGLHTEEIFALDSRVKAMEPYVMAEALFYRWLNAVDYIRQNVNGGNYATAVKPLIGKPNVNTFIDALDLNGEHDNDRTGLSNVCAWIIEKERLIEEDNRFAAECPYLNTYEPITQNSELLADAKYLMKQIPYLHELKLRCAGVLIPAAKALLTSDGYDKLVSTLNAKIADAKDGINIINEQGGGTNELDRARTKLNRLEQIASYMQKEQSRTEELQPDENGIYHTKLSGVTHADKNGISRQEHLKNADASAPLHAELSEYQGALSVAVKTESNLELGYLPAKLAARIESMYKNPKISIPAYKIKPPYEPGQSFGCDVSVKVENGEAR